MLVTSLGASRGKRQGALSGGRRSVHTAQRPRLTVRRSHQVHVSVKTTRHRLQSAIQDPDDRFIAHSSTDPSLSTSGSFAQPGAAGSTKSHHAQRLVRSTRS